MNVTQANTLINLINSQMFGDTTLTANDSRGLVSLGNTVLSSNTNKEKFLGLIDRIALTRLRTLDLEIEFPTLLRNSFEFGCIIQKINIQPFTAKPQNAWKVGDNDFTPSLYNIDKPVVVQKLFADGFGGFEFDVTIPDQMLKSAFESVEKFGAFIDGIMTALTDSMTIAINDLSYNCINNFIAEKCKAGNGVVNVLKMYNEQFSATHTNLESAILDKQFCRYSGMVIKNIMKYMSKPSKLYNTEGLVRATQRDNMHFIISSDVWTAYSTILMADTYWKDLVNLGGFKEFTTLQATDGVLPNITTNTQIDVIPASNASNDDTEVKVNGIMAIIADRESMGIGYDDRFSAVDRNNRDRYTNYTEGATLQYFNDLSENGVIIVANNEGLTVDKTTLTFANSSAAPQTITATTTPSGETVTWKSSKTSVATVSDGVVTPAGTGTCTITAKSVIGGQTYTQTTTVTVG